MRLAPSLRGSLYLAFAAAIWGGMYVVSRAALAIVPPLPLLWMRYVVALMTLFLIAATTRQSIRLPWKDVPLVLAIGVSGYAVSVWAQFAGTALSSAQMGAVVTSATPAFMIIFARPILGELFTWRRMFALALSSAGVLIIVAASGSSGGSEPSLSLTSMAGLASSSDLQRGAVLLVLAALTWALMSVLVKRVPVAHSQVTVAAYAIGFATLMLTPIALPQLHAVHAARLAEPIVWGGVLYLGIVSTAVAVVLWNRGLQLTDAATGGIYFFFQPLVGALLGWLALGEHLGWSFWLGAVWIVAGAALVLREGRSGLHSSYEVVRSGQ